ncbi:hypothetical protein FS749_002797 [Ceratobasidium sp. UAMH 11750]|nr:hypothetical protein FS749_002797 [Ceratobasidium sp. UAMH 11750]
MSAQDVSLSEEELIINALSLDSGSIVSLLSLITVVEELMRRVQRDQRLPELPRPGRHFKLIIGAGFSSLLAIMFGRLGLSIDESKIYCNSIIEDVFSEKKRFGTGKFKSRKLEAGIKRMLNACGVGEGARMLDPLASNADTCKVVICVASKHATRAGIPVRLRTYPLERNGVPDCTIAEALCAAFAVPGLFKPATIPEPGGIMSLYVGLGDFNPTALSLEEVPLLFPDGRMNCVTSIGTGQTQSVAMNCDRTAQEMSIRFQNTPGFYFRFDVGQEIRDIGMGDWRRRSEAVAHTRASLLMADHDARMSELAHMLGTRSSVISTAHVGGVISAQITSNYTITGCPPPSQLFTGRETELKQMGTCLADGSKERRVFVLYGLGGAGKTQLALQFAELHKDKYEHIFYIDATSATTIDTELKNIALAKKAGENPSDALSWLAEQPGKWLVVYNNADDPSLDLYPFFPACPRGKILVTTRNRRITTLAHGPGSNLHISGMLAEEAQELLAKATGVSSGLGDAGEVLVKASCCLSSSLVPPISPNLR